ncbi:NYN domain-containing protein [Arthrobacter sp. UM1]|uniref:NYN domain-containing protein n=1 Tax=Arthrobacter sp. UM1 TaxID=2766776 RepID=UPI001CF714FC|nr:NYN domain-containing protein [Arthrobacter sp. UM1]MCB4208491.1 NYN domain-containing protein [Arthrobacter sp. UM1]
MNKYVVMVDAGYLLASMARVLTGSSNRNMIQVSWEKLVQQMKQEIDELQQGQSPGAELLRVQWYDSPPEEFEGKRIAEEAFLAIDGISRTKTRIGRTSFGNQKGVDVKLALDIVNLSMRGLVTDLYLVSGDDDLTEAVELAQDYGVRVHLYNVGALEDAPVKAKFGLYSTATNLARRADERHTISADLIKRAASIAPRALPEDTPGEGEGRVEAAARMAAAAAGVPPAASAETVSLVEDAVAAAAAHTADDAELPAPSDAAATANQATGVMAEAGAAHAADGYSLERSGADTAAGEAALAEEAIPARTPENASGRGSADNATGVADRSTPESARPTGREEPADGGESGAPSSSGKKSGGGKSAASATGATAADAAKDEKPSPDGTSRKEQGGESGKAAGSEPAGPPKPMTPSAVPIRRQGLAFRPPVPGARYDDYERQTSETLHAAIEQVVKQTVGTLVRVGRVDSLMRRYVRPNIPSDIDRALLIDICLAMGEPEMDIAPWDREQMRAVFWDEIESVSSSGQS